MMTTTSARKAIAAGDDDQGLRSRSEPREVVELLSDDEVVDIFRTASMPMTVSELATECDVPLSTAYRKVTNLEEAGLLRQTNPQAANGTTPAYYARAVDSVSVTLGDDLRIEVVS